MSDLVAQPGDSTRASDADRDAVLRLLATATSDGRLTVEEHAEFMSKALNARTLGELDVITKDLHPAPGGAQAEVVGARTGGSSRKLVSILGARSRKGVWHMPRELTAVAVLGAVELDFRDAQFDATEVYLNAHSCFGAVEVTVPEWVRVEEEGHAILGAREVRGPRATVGPHDGPKVTLHIRGVSILGALEVKVKAPKVPRHKDRELRRDL